MVAPGEAAATQGIELVHDRESGSLTGAFCTPDDMWSCGEEQIEGEVVGRSLTISWTVRIDGELRNETLTAELSAGGSAFSGTVTQRLESGEVREIEVVGSRW